MTLSSATQFAVPGWIVSETERSLRTAGKEGYELFVLWSGRLQGQRFAVMDAHIPRQTSYRTPQGLLVRVEAEALHQLNKWLYANAQTVAVQIHAHPNADARHSDTDDTYPIVSTEGSLSLVAPDFCHSPLLGPMTRGYRLSVRGWTPIPVVSLLKVAN